MNTFGFTKVDINEHDFARFLRKVKAIDNWHTIGKSNQWYEPSGRVVALCIYSGGVECDYWIRNDKQHVNSND